MKFNICPVKFVGEDVIELVDAYRLAGERASLSEQWEFPPPYLQAWDWVAVYIDQLRESLVPKPKG